MLKITLVLRRDTQSLGHLLLCQTLLGTEPR
jgi:hypothetical protein